jgi:hypothetical protein
VMATYRCEQCEGEFEEGWSDEQAHQEAEAAFGRRGDDPSMAKVCDDCYQEIMTRIRPGQPWWDEC